MLQMHFLSHRWKGNRKVYKCSYDNPTNTDETTQTDQQHNSDAQAINTPTVLTNQTLPGACNRSPGSKLLSITTQLHCGGHLGGRAQLPDTILEEDHPMTIPSKFGFNWATGSRQDGFYVNFP